LVHRLVGRPQWLVGEGGLGDDPAIVLADADPGGERDGAERSTFPREGVARGSWLAAAETH